MLDENPFLEVTAEMAEREEFGLQHANQQPQVDTYAADDGSDIASTELPGDLTPVQALDWDGSNDWDISADDSEWGADAGMYTGTGASITEDDDATAQDLAYSHESLTEHLHRQALSLRLSELDRAALRFLIENLNDDGYLEDSLLTLAQGLAGSDEVEQTQALIHHFTVALHLLQTLEPAGVGARNLAECLHLQLLHRPPQDYVHADVLQVALQICAQPLELLARRDVRRLMQSCAAPEMQVRAALGLIATLEPKPGRRFTNVQRHIIVPDVIVKRSSYRGSKESPQFSVQLNPDVMPRLRVQEVYATALRNHRGSEGHAALQQRLQEARWFIKNIQQRFDTILRVSRAIVERQKNFFVHGELAMRPLVLRDIADELGLHESTISRVTTAKYMATPQGTYELKYFFGSGLGTETGSNASSTAVRALIKQFIVAENPRKPLSDSQIADLLKEQGIECARRTVAKYREALKIAPANLRKAL